MTVRGGGRGPVIFHAEIKGNEQHMKRKITLLALAGVLALAGCVDPNAHPDDPNARQKQGALIGAVSGAALGATTGHGGKLGRAAVGAVAGGIAGGVIGNYLDRQAQELRADLPPEVGVTNYGDYVNVNMPSALLFATDSASVGPNQTRDLRTVAASLLKYPQSRIEVVGHTDSTGTAAYNMDLSRRRAGSVASILINAGVPSSRISTYGQGEDQPVASNLTAEGRAQNRRVEILIRPTN